MAACGSDPDDLALESVTASKIPSRLDSTVTISGQGFTALFTVDLGSDDPPTIDATMVVEVGDTALATSDITVVDAATLEVVVPAGFPVGVHDVRVVAPDGRDSVLVDALTVANAAMRIEDAPGGAGDPVDGAVIMLGSTLDLHAVTRFTDDSGFIRDEQVTWTVTGAVGTIAPDSGSATTFTGNAIGTSVVMASSTIFGDDETGDLIVIDDIPGMIPPLPSIDVTPGAGDTTTTFVADASGTTDYDEPAAGLTYEWDWENDGAFDDTGITATHMYPANGDYRIALRVTDSDGLSAFATFSVVVTDTGDLIEVTTPADENDAGATPMAPGGSGFSLREAIIYANGQPDRQTILVPSGLTIDLTSGLPTLIDNSGVDIVGDGATVTGTGGACFVIEANDNRIMGLTVRQCNIAINIRSGAGNRVERCRLHDNNIGAGILSDDNTVGPDNDMFANADAVDIDGKTIVEGNRIHDNTAHAVFTHADADASQIVGNTMYRNTRAIEFQTLSASVIIAHNTMHGHTLQCLNTPASSNTTDMRNNIFSGGGSAGYDAFDSQFEFRDYNLYFDNAGGPCTSCSGPGPNSVEADPLYVLPAADDYRLLPASPAVNAGLDLGFDINGPASGDFEGAAPDIGGSESPY